MEKHSSSLIVSVLLPWLHNYHFYRHLPLYLVAAFAKRIARLSLTAPPQGLIIINEYNYY